MQIKKINNTVFEKLNKKIIACNKCSRLVKFEKKFHQKRENNTFMKHIGENRLQDLEIKMEKYYL